MTSDPASPLLHVSNLHIQFGRGSNQTNAVRGISFHISSGETVAVVGESGSGKSVTALSLTRLLPSPPTYYPQGEIFFDSTNILQAKENELRKIRGKQIAYIFQEPGSSLNPVFTIGYQLAEALQLHRPDIKNIQKEIIHSLELVGIHNPATRLGDYPHQLSGGMQQRIMIAMALSCQPQLLIADEPTTALDVTIQKQIIDLLRHLKNKLHMAILLITHNFGIVSGFADRILVMFRGQIVEEGPTQQILSHPQHPYTQALIECVPRLGQKQARLKTIDHEQLENISATPPPSP